MKKKKLVMMTGMIAAAMLSVGCGKKEAADTAAVESTAAAETTQDVAQMDAELAQMANPVVEQDSVEQISKVVGFDMISFPEEMKVTDLTCFTISETLGEVRGTTADGHAVSVRKQKGDTDISGYFGVTFDEAKVGDLTVNVCDADGTQVAWWVKGDYCYALTEEGIDQTGFMEVLQKVAELD